MEARGENGCFTNTMRALFKTIRDRFRPQRARQRTKNYRICRNLAMDKIESEKKKRAKNHLTSGLNAVIKKRNQAANVDMSQRKVPEEDGAPGDLQKRIRSSQRALQEKHKPYWVLHRGWKQCSMVDLNMEVTEAKHHLPNDKGNMEDALVDEEPAIWMMAHAQVWQKKAEPDPISGDKITVMHSGPGSKSPVPTEWTLDYLVEALGSSDNEKGGEQGDTPGLGSFKANEAAEDLEAIEPASWVVANGNMWQHMTKHLSPVLYSGPGSSYFLTSEWTLDYLTSGESTEFWTAHTSSWAANDLSPWLLNCSLD